MMLEQPQHKYRPVHPFTRDYAERTWPSRRLDAPPIWMSTDMRDGNQALIEPMDAARKLRFFEQLVAVGLKEIEVAFPSASDTDFNFVRQLIEEERIPDDVTIEVLTQSRPDLIERTFESLRGARRAIVHLYNPIAPQWRRIVFGMSRDEIKDLALAGTRQIRALADADPGTEWIYEYSPETFSLAELDYALEVCDAVSAIWNPSPERKMIINLPSTVECASANVYADQIEWMHRRLARRDSIVLSVHPHNDRGTAVAAAELAVMAGADRVEGCLFGNGERCGNLDLVTVALNLYTQGVHPGLDFSDINAVARVAEECTGLPIHPRHPYAGDLVFTSFSGSHQDAIKKGFAAHDPEGPWQIPYLPIDPADLGRTYDSVIRVNSQSGKGGIAFLLERDQGVVMPRRMQVEFSAMVQRATDASETEMTGDALWALFQATYLRQPQGVPGLVTYHAHRLAGDGRGIEIDVAIDGARLTLQGQGSGPIDAAVDALGLPLSVHAYEERVTGTGAGAQALAIVEASLHGLPGATFGVGLHHNIVTASVQAVVGVANRLLQRRHAQARPVHPARATAMV